MSHIQRLYSTALQLQQGERSRHQFEHHRAILDLGAQPGDAGGENAPMVARHGAARAAGRAAAGREPPTERAAATDDELSDTTCESKRAIHTDVVKELGTVQDVDALQAEARASAASARQSPTAMRRSPSGA